MLAHAWSVAVLEDDAPMREFFADCVRRSPELELRSTFDTLAQARAWLSDNLVDVLLTDLALPDGHALSLIAEVARQQPACEVIVISVFGDEDNVLASIEAGAVGYIHKDSRPDDIAQTILDVKQGASPISPMVARKLLARLRKVGADLPAGGRMSVTPSALPAPSGKVDAVVALSPREVEVLDLIARGYSYGEIARLQGISLHTVQSHIRNLYGKLAVHSRGEAVFEASRMGLLPLFGSKPLNG